jgi:serine protease Do
MQQKSRYFLILIILLSASALCAGCVGAPNFSFSSASLPVTAQSWSDILPSANSTFTPLETEIINKVRPAIVAIDAEFSAGDSSGSQSAGHVIGSGWILDSSSLIVTNSHVVEGATTVSVTLSNGQSYNAKTTKNDSVDDLAVIDIGISNITGIAIGDSSKVKDGDRVIAIGNALTDGIKATQGTISSTNSTFKVDVRETLYNMLETTAPIDYGYSGSPLLNMDGEVIGIITGACMTRYGTEVAGYAISSCIAEPIIQHLSQNDQ